jgi:large subunit ribosomal protein L18
MDAAKKRKRQARDRRHRRIRKQIEGTAAAPRLSVYRSNDHIYAQLIDDVVGHTLLAASSLEKDVAKGDDGKVGVARQVGERLGQRAIDAGITTCVFDRGGNRYAGRVKALADGARDAGLKF